MGICWSWCSRNSSPVSASNTPTPPPAAEPIPDPDTVPSSVANIIDEDPSFVGSNVSGTSWVSMVTNVTTLLSQVSGAIAAFWGNNPAEENEFSAAIEDDHLPDVGTASDSKLIAFTFAQVKAATLNFRSDLVLGRGGFGCVYKGWIKEKLPSQGTRKRTIAGKTLDAFRKENVPSQGTRKRIIAVKKLDASSKQGFRQWRTEVGFLARLSHPNIIKLLGYCKENENLLIVYEFMQKGSLNYHLFGRKSDWLLPWEVRVKIMIGMAQGLSYLHTMEKPIICRDFKSSNVLLDESYVPKISDFGLAKWGPTAGNSCVPGHVMGTVGYTAPEYITTGNLFVKSDVYSFGVVLLEMLTGMRAIDNKRPTLQRNLVKWSPPYLLAKRKLKTIMDSRLEGKYSMKEAFQISRVAIACVNAEPQLRPSMNEVAEKLEKIGASYA